MRPLAARLRVTILQAKLCAYRLRHAAADEAVQAAEGLHGKSRTFAGTPGQLEQLAQRSIPTRDRSLAGVAIAHEPFAARGEVDAQLRLVAQPADASRGGGDVADGEEQRGLPVDKTALQA